MLEHLQERKQKQKKVILVFMYLHDAVHALAIIAKFIKRTNSSELESEALVWQGGEHDYDVVSLVKHSLKH